jgi:branched-subunit amino acid ABC-type transport system permease component
MQTAPTLTGKKQNPLLRLLIAVPLIYIGLLALQPAGLDIPRIIQTIVNDPGILVQQLINGLANGAIIAIVALGYTLVYGIIELVNFANSEVFMLGTLTSLVALSPFIILSEDGGQSAPWWAALLAFIPAMLMGALLNVSIERIAYRRLRNSPKIVVLISAIGMSFILQNIGLQLGAFGKLTQAGPQFGFLSVLGSNNAAPKSFPRVFSDDNLLDYIFPPPIEEVAPARQAQGDLSAEDVQATVQAQLDEQFNAQGTADAQFTPEAGGEEGVTEEATQDPNATPESPTAEEAGAEETATPDLGIATEEPIPTLDPTAAAEETAIMAELAVQETDAAATSVADGTPLPETVAEGEDEVDPNATQEPTPDLIATMEAENGGTPIVIPDTNSAQPAGNGQSGQVTPQQLNKTRLRITFKDVLVITVALILMLALNWFINKTKVGKAMRATASNRAAAQIMGINIDRIIALTFGIGGALAGAAGMMTGIYNGTFVFTMGFTAGLRSFTAAVLGGIGNITGAALGGILIGILAAFSDQFLSVRWTNAWVFLILVLVMLFKPTGLLGQDGGEKA